ncbi:hypothetical protein [Pedobacter nyackensis]|uniref:Uncharacterized protein n=1 Tax=Pedobacter nyackensis TaxID=475255 RepID=A0A1W1ZY85_9SPHI|nr:hypothetical protein [Pedobacter nyackensis]SMC53459.1 hypothetical protein SAMN04488101_101159 [Pedobacter nyackensis]
MEENQTPKQDMVDRKAAWIERMFDKLYAATIKNPYGALLVVSVLMNIWQFNIAANKDVRWQEDITKLNDKINAAVERSVQRELPKQMVTIQAKQDSVSKNVDTSLLNLNGTLETVRKLIKNKK